MIIVSYGTADGIYDRYLEQLDASCAAHGLRRDFRTIPPAGRIAACLQKPAFIRDMLAKHGEPVVWLDADTVVNRAFALPDGGWDVGLVPNTSWRKRRLRPVCAFVVAVAPTEAARTFLETWIHLCARPELAPGRTDHGRLIWTREMQAGHYAECDLSRCLRRALTRDVGSRKERTL